MLKEVKKWGNSLVIRFSPEECKIYELEEGNTIELCIIKENKKKLK